MRLYRFEIATSLFAYATLGANISLHCPQGQLCLTTFKQCYNNYEEACRPPPGSYPWVASENSAQLPALLGGTDYTLSWVFGPDGQADIPVRIQWQMDGIVWETNTTASEYIFNPGKILASFPTPQAPSVSPEIAWFNASQYSDNVLIISQPEAVGTGNDFPVALSQQFTVQSDVIEDYIQTQIEISRQTEYNMWRLGVSIGLGIGIPFLVCITTLAVLVIAKMRSEKQLDEGVETAHNEAEIY
ncbi:hypothetical protein F4801DRAFT_595172 [Xylaria longipes]|nr:hypothetical protein F4801DRAFT_595172 [Xylaria longipes]RYC56485.1 hypothetical protein CHU98_g9725 [Xylaria longipes]